jgi:hypothetical protein
MLEGHPHAKVRRQREGRDHFCGTDGSADGRSIVGHPATVTERLISSLRLTNCRTSSELLASSAAFALCFAAFLVNSLN